MIDGKRFNESLLYDPANPWENRDSRFEGTFFYPGTVFGGHTLTENNFSLNGAEKSIKIASRKWKIETTDDSFASNESADMILMRYADVLLMYAEAVNETSGPTTEVYKAVNKIRDRALMPDFSAGMSQDLMRDEIKHERKIEFFMEGTRYFDLLRWRDAEIVIPLVKDEARVFDPRKHYLWPIPQFAIDQSPGLTQNPGY
jgi:hypothetical protein